MVTVDQQLEQIMESVQQTDKGSYIAMDPDLVQTILNNLSHQIQKLINLGDNL